MLVLTVENKVINTDNISIGDEVHHSILSFKDLKEPDFFFEMIQFLEEFSSASITLKVGKHEIVMPLHWSILCSDMEYLQSIPLADVGGKQFPVFCLNPIDGYSPEFFPLRTGTIFPQTTWTAPQLGDKDLLVVPLGEGDRPGDNKRGPLCCMFSASKFEVYRPIGDIW